MPIQNFNDKETERLFREGVCPPHLRASRAVASRKLDMLNAAVKLIDLRVPPGNRLEALKGNRAGQYSICVNEQWRVCFRWTDSGPEGVEIVDYHG
jgi:proteic killer suppression protein